MLRGITAIACALVAAATLAPAALADFPYEFSGPPNDLQGKVDWMYAADQEPGNENFNFIFFDPITGDFGTVDRNVGSLKLDSYNLVNLSAGIEWDRGLEVSVYVNNLFDENALLSFDRERGGRARQGFNISTPRTVGVTTRIKFGH